MTIFPETSSPETHFPEHLLASELASWPAFGKSMQRARSSQPASQAATASQLASLPAIAKSLPTYVLHVYSTSRPCQKGQKIIDEMPGKDSWPVLEF